nr:MAG TPA: hypothetical protein [Caudoviricetes sp.]
MIAKFWRCFVCFVWKNPALCNYAGFIFQLNLTGF